MNDIYLPNDQNLFKAFSLIQRFDHNIEGFLAVNKMYYFLTFSWLTPHSWKNIKIN